MPIRGILFDFDGTLTEPGSLDFQQIREAIGCPKGTPILEFIEGLASDPARRDAHAVLHRFEMEAAALSRPNRGAENLVLELKGRGFKLGILTRNSAAAIQRMLKNFARLDQDAFDLIFSRDDCFLPKPNPDAVLAAASRMGLPPGDLLVVGDYVFDVEAGRRAGAHTVFLTNRDPGSRCPVESDHVIHCLDELWEIPPLYVPLGAGKLPNRWLGPFLQEMQVHDPSLIIAPGVGEDIAAVGIDGHEVLVLKSDPITLATDAIARYAVAVNANDVATSGAVPRWLVASLFFPPGSCAAEIRAVMKQLARACSEAGLLLCGGHTEITCAVTRPVISAHVAGTVARRCLLDKRNVRPGDQVILTKRLAVEGTSVLARELGPRLKGLGLTDAELEKCRSFLETPGISVMMEARIASGDSRTVAMHDVTEGGLATALEELSAACGHRLRVYREQIPVYEETERICHLLGMNPLGLLGSGSLVIIRRPEGCGRLLADLAAAGIEACLIGEFLGPGSGVEAMHGTGAPAEWPRFEVDEIARLSGRDL